MLRLMVVGVGMGGGEYNRNIQVASFFCVFEATTQLARVSKI